MIQLYGIQHKHLLVILEDLNPRYHKHLNIHLWWAEVT